VISRRAFPRRGNVLHADLSRGVGPASAGTVGAEERGDRRPVVVVSYDPYNQIGQVVIVVPISTLGGRVGPGYQPHPTEVFLPTGEGGLTQDSIAMCGHVRTISILRLADAYGNPLTRTNSGLGTISDAKMLEIGEKLGTVLGLK
jgi:mRNA interferase MazF